jgi:hypothetical protein
VRVLGHRQTKEAATDNPHLMSPRHIPTLQIQGVSTAGRSWSSDSADQDLVTESVLRGKAQIAQSLLQSVGVIRVSFIGSRFNE